MIFADKFKKKYWGNYRAKVESIDTKNKNGIYQVRVYPWMATMKLDVLPPATSTLTTRYRHIQLQVGDWVWVFFENGDQHFPVIWDLCNFKDSYPTPQSASYGSYDKIKLGGVTIEIDEEKNSITVSGSGDINIVSTSGDVTINAQNAILNSPNVVLGAGITGYVVTCPVPGISTVAEGMPIQSSTTIQGAL